MIKPSRIKERSCELEEDEEAEVVIRLTALNPQTNRNIVRSSQKRKRIESITFNFILLRDKKYLDLNLGLMLSLESIAILDLVFEQQE